MRGQHADKLWIAGGSFVAVVLFLLTWTLLVMPKNDETKTVRAATTEAIATADRQRQALKDLEQDSANLPAYQAELKKYANALPATDEFPNLLRSLRELAEKHKVEVTTLSVAGSTKVEGATPAIYDMPLSMTVAGALDDVQRFLNALQQQQDRAVLINSVSLTDDGAALGKGTATATLTMHVFVSGDGPPVADGQTAVS